MTDLHIHSVLSPCAAVEMTPRHIVRQAEARGINIIAITDHNASDNIEAAFEAARGTGVTIIPGIEVEAKEEVHLIALFPNMVQLHVFQQFIDEHLPPVLNDDKKFGAQFIVDGEDNLIRIKKQMLLLSVQIGVNELSRKVAELGGICIASHIDRPSYSIMSQLGFIPPDMQLDGLEISRNNHIDVITQRFPIVSRYQVLTFSDAHTILDLLSGPKCLFYVEEPNFSELRMAIYQEKGRKVVCNCFLSGH